MKDRASMEAIKKSLVAVNSCNATKERKRNLKNYILGLAEGFAMANTVTTAKE